VKETDEFELDDAVAVCAKCLTSEDCDGSCGKINGVHSLEDGSLSICGALVLADDECIVSLAENGTGYIIARSNWLIERDVLLEETVEDCNFTDSWDQGLLVGVYKLNVEPWSDGVGEAGISVNKVTPLWTAPKNKPNTEPKLFEHGWLDDRRHIDKHAPIVYSPSETMALLLLARRANLWQVISEPGQHVILKIWHGEDWWELCRTDLYDHVATRFPSNPRVDTMFWQDPLARLVKIWSYGMREDESTKTLFLVDRTSDG
jgi:hypothetical protein